MDNFNAIILTDGIENLSSPSTTVQSESSGSLTAQKTKSLFGNNSFLFIMIAVFLIMWLLMIRPQSKKQKEMQKMLASLEKGDKVVTAGGIRGVVETTKDDVVTIKSGESKIDLNKNAITAVLEKKNPLPIEEKKSIFSKFKKNK